MTPEEYADYRRWLKSRSEPPPEIRGDELTTAPDEAPRLLVHGYDFDRQDFKVWHSPELGIGLQLSRGDILWRDSWPAFNLRPPKRGFPDRTDPVFARLIAERHDLPITFTRYPKESPS